MTDEFDAKAKQICAKLSDSHLDPEFAVKIISEALRSAVMREREECEMIIKRFEEKNLTVANDGKNCSQTKALFVSIAQAADFLATSIRFRSKYYSSLHRS